jgi:hypothetical protein
MQESEYNQTMKSLPDTRDTFRNKSYEDESNSNDVEMKPENYYSIKEDDKNKKNLNVN